MMAQVALLASVSVCVVGLSLACTKYMGFPLTLSGQTAPVESQGGTSLSTQSDQAADPNPGHREGECKQLIDTSE